MNHRNFLLALLGIVSVALLALVPASRAWEQQNKDTTQWEYKIIDGTVKKLSSNGRSGVQSLLKGSGAEGWELVELSEGG